MNEDDNLTVVKRLLAAFSRPDLGTIRASLTPDVRFHVPGNNLLAGEYTGIEQVLDLLARIWEVTDGTIRVSLHDALANEQHGVLLYTVSAKRRDASYTYRQLDLYHFRDGRVSEVWGYPVDLRGFDDFYS